MSIQCDWISAKTVSLLPVGYDPGRIIKLGPGGEFLGESFSPVFVEDDSPSSSDKMRVYTPDPHTLWLSGNPCKIFQGHNLWGSHDHLGLYLEAGVWVREKAGFFPGPETFEACGFEAPTFTRLDLTRSYRFDSHAIAQEFIRHVAGSSRSRHGAAKLYDSSTAYFGQHSTRWTFKVYDKGTEYLRHVKKSLPKMVYDGLIAALGRPGGWHDTLLDWSQGVVRFELCLRAPELKKIPTEILLFASESELQDIWQSYFDKITWTENAAMSKNLPLDKVPPKMRPVLLAWSTGADIRSMYPHRTFYRYRKDIIEACGVDISVPPPLDSEAPKDQAVSAQLDPKGWDPEPLASEKFFHPREEIKSRYIRPETIRTPQETERLRNQFDVTGRPPRFRTSCG